MRIVGIDLAWGTRRPDGWCVISGHRRRATVTGWGLWRGDSALLNGLRAQRRQSRSGWVLIDAPLICPNLTGARPVDLEMNRLFRRFHAGCHPANLTLCSRPAHLMATLQAAGYQTPRPSSPTKPPQPAAHAWHVVEVYPHAALVRFLNLNQIIKYKRGTIANRRAAFAELQLRLRTLLASHFPEVTIHAPLDTFLSSPWTKNIEDQTDALICALVGWWHWKHRGTRSQWVGDPQSGLLLLPAMGSHLP